MYVGITVVTFIHCGILLCTIIMHNHTLILETQKFYETLSKTGTDFTMMTAWFPKRTRMELKVTYNVLL